MRRLNTHALILLAVVTLAVTGCRGNRVHQDAGGGGPIGPTPDPMFGGGGGAPPMLPPAASNRGPGPLSRTVSRASKMNPFRHAVRSETSPSLLPTPDTGIPEAVSAPTLW